MTTPTHARGFIISPKTAWSWSFTSILFYTAGRERPRYILLGAFNLDGTASNQYIPYIVSCD